MHDVVVRNPGAKHSLGVGILQRCKIRFEGSLGYFGVGLIDGPEVHITGRVGWSVAENMMSGVVVIEKNAGSLTGAAIRGGDLVVKGEVGARTGIDQKGGTIIVRRQRRHDDRLHDAARAARSSAATSAPASATRCTTASIYVGGKVTSLGVDCIEAELDRRRHVRCSTASSATTASTARTASGSSSARRSSGTTTPSSPANASWCSEAPRNDRSDYGGRALEQEHPRAQPDLHAGGHQRHPRQVRARPLPDARLLAVQEDAELGRADVPARARSPGS